MRKPDNEVREVVCSETGKPMPKIPLWMADIKVKFLSDEARQKHSSSHSTTTLDIEKPRRAPAKPKDEMPVSPVAVAEPDEEEEDEVFEEEEEEVDNDVDENLDGEEFND